LFFTFNYEHVEESSQSNVAIEKNPNTSAEAAEKANANRFLYLSCRATDTTDKIVTANSKIPKTIINSPPCSYTRLN